MAAKPFEGSYTVTFTSESGRPLDRVTKAPSTAIGVYDDADLGRRVREAAKDPDITTTVKYVS